MTCLWNAGLFLLPSPVHMLLQHHPIRHELHKEVRGDTAYLDGLRGIAALIVYFLHHGMIFDSTILLGYGPGLGDSLLHLPLLRIVRSGKAMVRVFFVLSGYVLTISPAKYMQEPEDAGRLHSCLAIGTVKRPLRLFLPPLAVTFLVMLLVAQGAHPTAQQLSTFPARLEIYTVIHQSTFALQILDWLGFVFFKLMNPWQWTESLFANMQDSYYGMHLWTIQTEFRCSIIVFMVLQILSIAKRQTSRWLLQLLLVAYCIAWSRWDVALFIVGMALSLADAAQNWRQSYSILDPVDSTIHEAIENLDYCEDTTSREVKLHKIQFRSLSTATFSTLVLLIGLWMLSYPDDKARHALGFELASQIISSADVWQSVGAVALLWSAGRLHCVQRWLSTKLLQYLGSLSFSLYLVHYPFLEILGWKLQLMCQVHVTGTVEEMGVPKSIAGLVGNGSGLLVVTTLLLYISDVAYRAIDLSSQRLSRWLVSTL